MTFTPWENSLECRPALLSTALSAAAKAGREIMEVYQTSFDVDYKLDRSPVTDADRRAHEAIAKVLAVSGLPILSEEGKDIPFEKRRSWKNFWMVDPLDGTKEFINRNGEFTVNIALVEDGIPVLGVVFAPERDIVYFGIQGHGAYKVEKAFDFFRKADFLEAGPGPAAVLPGGNQVFNRMVGKESPAERAEKTAANEARLNALIEGSGSRLPIFPQGPERYTIVGSRSHGGREMEEYIGQIRRKYGDVVFLPAGSSLKICLVAEGSADLYPRLGTTMEWDTAAGHAVAVAAGAIVHEFDKDKPLLYNKADLRNPWFRVERKNSGS